MHHGKGARTQPDAGQHGRDDLERQITIPGFCNLAYNCNGLVNLAGARKDLANVVQGLCAGLLAFDVIQIAQSIRYSPALTCSTATAANPASLP